MSFLLFLMEAAKRGSYGVFLMKVEMTRGGAGSVGQLTILPLHAHVQRALLRTAHRRLEP